MGRDSVVCIEGFPRSANSYAVEIFWRRNGRLPTAHHLHVPGQVLEAQRLGRPCALLVRRPLDALSSLLIVDERLSPSVVLWSYIDFHRRCWPARDAVAVCCFDEVIGDASVVARRLNERFGTDFDGRPVDQGEREQALASLAELNRRERHARWLLAVPHPEKERLKARAGDALRRHRRMVEAELWFERWASRAGPGEGVPA